MKEFEHILIEKQINPTAIRIVVLDFLLKQSCAISLTELELGLERCDRVTLFRTLKTFVEQGLVHRIENGSGITKFALCQQECDAGQHHDTHVHFYCNTCKETFCLPKTSIPDVILPMNFQSREMNLIIKGICSGCKVNNAI